LDGDEEAGPAQESAPDTPELPVQDPPSDIAEPGGWDNEPGDLGPLGSTTELRGGREPGSVRFPIERHEPTIRPHNVGQEPDRSVEFTEGEPGATDD
jgi:hypothetical protein